MSVHQTINLRPRGHTPMLIQRQLATLRAALQFWREEICPHGEAAARPYLDFDEITPLTMNEVDELRDRFDPPALRYAVIAPDHIRLQSTTLLATVEEAESRGGNGPVATVIMPVA